MPDSSPSASLNTETTREELKGHVIICGLRNTGFRVLEQLLKTHLKTVVLDNAPDPRFAEMARALGVDVLDLDSRTEFALREARVEFASSIIAVTDNDLHNLETVLTACELAPQIRAVASFYNQQIGEQLIKSVPNAQALSIPGLAATTFVTASLPSQVLHLFKIAGEEMAVVMDRAGKESDLQKLYGQLIPVMLRRGLLNSPEAERGEEPRSANGKREHYHECPAPGTPVQEGDLVTLVGRVDDLLALEEVSLNEKQVAAVRNPARTRRHRLKKPGKARLTVGDYLKSLFGDVDRPLRRTIVAITLLVICGMVVFLLVKNNYNLADALYATMITISSNYNTEPGDTWLFKLFAVFLIIVGTALLGVVYGYITNYIVSARLSQALGQQKITRMQNHVVLTGLGSVGYLVVKGLLERGEQVAVLEVDERNRYISLARSQGVPVILADARVAESLDLANVSKARCITIMTNDDLANLETALNARARNPGIRVVLRLFDRNLAERTERAFNIPIARSASALAAPYFIAAALNFEVVTSFYVESTPFFVARLTIHPGTPLSHLQVEDVYARAGVSVLAYLPHPARIEQNPINGISRDGLTRFEVRELSPVFHPTPQQALQEGDIIYFVGPYERITSAYKLNS